MEQKITFLTPFFMHPRRAFHIRELAKIVHLSHTSIRKHIPSLVKEGYLQIKKETPYDKYLANITSPKYLSLKQYYHREQLRESGLMAYLEKVFDYPTLVLFGSYAKGLDDEESDIDIGVLSEAKPVVNFDKYERLLQRKISIHLFTKKDWETTKKKNHNLINNICNGTVLGGELEVLP
ncbi:MAG: nucleotidyltransferase domain-containing protein [Nanoarchaeota archaeon]